MKMKCFIGTFVTFCTLFLVVAIARHDIYNGYKVYKFKLSQVSQASLLESVASEIELDFWENPTLVRDGLVMVTPSDQEYFEGQLRMGQLEYSLFTEDVKKLLDDFDTASAEYQQAHKRNDGELSDQLDLDRYYRYDEIISYITSLADKYPDKITVVDGGNSFEGRSIKYVKISSTNFADSTKPIVILDAAIHAREWISPPVALYSIQQLVVDNAAPDLLSDVDWIIVPVVNPDGYEFTHTDERLWRKTRSTNHEGGPECPGVDGNRNYDFSWMEIGASADPCSITYAGPSPFSEPEVKIVGDIMTENVDRTKLYISLHSSGSVVLYPWGHNGSLPENGEDLHAVGSIIAETINENKSPEAVDYLAGNSATSLYPTSGSSDDYARFLGIPYSYTVELPNFGYSFELPPSYIEQVVKETWLGIAEGTRVAIVL